MVKLKALGEMFKEEEIRGILGTSDSDMSNEIDFEAFLRVRIYVDSFLTYSIFQVSFLCLPIL